MKFLISNRFKLMIGVSPKCANTSIKKWFLDMHGIHFGGDYHDMQHYLGFGNTEWTNPFITNVDGFYKCSFVRNPYHRLVSGFIQWTSIGNDVQVVTFREFVELLASDPEVKRTYQMSHYVDQFDQYFFNVFKEGKITHNAPVFDITDMQSNMTTIYHHNPHLPIVDLLHINKSTLNNTASPRPMWDTHITEIINSNVRYDYSCYYNREIKQIVMDLYQADLFICGRHGIYYNVTTYDSL